MDPVVSAKRLVMHIEQVEDVGAMAHVRGGDARRVHDFVNVDLPLMIDVQEGRKPSEREDLSPRQKALLELTPVDMAAQINSNIKSARRALGWTAPFAQGEIKDFVLTQDDFTKKLSEDLVVHVALQSEPDRKSLYVNSEKNPLSAEYFEQFREQEASSGYYRPGDMVIVQPPLESRDPTQNPFEAPAKKIEQVELGRLSENSAMYVAQYHIEGEDQPRNNGDLLDPRGTQHGYGVITEAAGRLYYVETENAMSGLEPEAMVAREIIGIERNWQERIKLQVGTEDGVPSNMREMLDMTEARPKPIAGEFTYHGVDGPGSNHGPIVLEASSWQSGASAEEAGYARAAIDQHLARYEFPDLSSGKSNAPEKSKSLEIRTEYERHPQMTAMQQAAQAAHYNGFG